MKLRTARKKCSTAGRLTVLIALLLCCGTVTVSAAVDRIDKDQLKAMLTDDDVVVIDTRTGMDWSSSEFKIKGAVRLTPDTLEELAARYPKATRLIFYCA